MWVVEYIVLDVWVVPVCDFIHYSVCCVMCGWCQCVSWGAVTSRPTVDPTLDTYCTLETPCGGEGVKGLIILLVGVRG